MNEPVLFKRYDTRIRAVYLLTIIVAILVIALTRSSGIYTYLPFIPLIIAPFWARGFNQDLWKRIKLRRMERLKTDQAYKTKAIWSAVIGLVVVAAGLYCMLTMATPVIIPAFIAVYAVYGFVITFLFPAADTASPAELND